MAAEQVLKSMCFSLRTRGRVTWRHRVRTRAGHVVLGALVLATVYGSSVPAHGQTSEQNRPVEDVLEAFDNLTHHGEWMGYHNGAGSPVRYNTPASILDGFCTGRENHIQGVARSPQPGVPYFYVSSAGAFADLDELIGPSNANLMVVKMESRDQTGERLRSNRLIRDQETSCTAPPSVLDTTPPIIVHDMVVNSIVFPNYRHPGGLQMVGDILAVPLEQPRTDLNFCDGGERHGEDCSCDDVCPGGFCVVAGSCDGGGNAGAECDEDEDCPGGTCPTETFCTGGDKDGELCTFDDGCPGNGTCIISKVCDGGNNHLGKCETNAGCRRCEEGDDDCPKYGMCQSLPGGRVLFYDASDPATPTLIYTLDLYGSPLPLSTHCYGGAEDGHDCSSEYDCHGLCRETMAPCMSDYECPSGTLCDNPKPGTCGYASEAGFVGVAKLPDGHFLLVDGMHGGSYIAFWRSNKTSFFEEGFKFEFHDHWDYHDLRGAPPGHEDDPDWRWTLSGSHQNLSLVNQEDDHLFLIGGRNENIAAPMMRGNDLLVLYEIEGFEEGAEIQMTQLRAPHVVSFINDSSLIPPFNPGDYPPCGTCTPTEATNADMLAGTTTYISPSGELLVYATTHYNDGPEGLDGDPIVRMGELRHVHVVRDDSPTYDASADAGGPYVVDEGSTVQLDGGASGPPLAAPWVQLFEHTNFQGQSVMFDHADENEDDYDNFAKLDGQLLFDVCVDSQALADVAAAGNVVKSAWQNLTAEDFITNACIGWWRDGECWVTPPVTGTKECWGGPLPGCGPCVPGVYTFNTGCTAIPGIPGIVGPIPDFNATAWSFFGKLAVLVPKVDVLLRSMEECGRVFDALGSPPPLPDALKVFDPAHYVDFDINDLPAFAASFPSFVANLTTALGDVPGFIRSVEDYVNELLESLKGFNNRASSVRWYAPVGVDIVMYEKAYMVGGGLTLPGTGIVEETANLSSKLLDPPNSSQLRAGDLIRSMEFVGTFSNPTLESFAWSIVLPTPAEPLILLDATTATPMFDATSADGPTTATVELVVNDSAGGVASATALVDVLNVAPEVTIDRIEDQTGADIYDGVPVLLEALEYALLGSHTDAGIPDTHTATVAWGDGSSDGSDDRVFQFTDSLGGVTGTLRVPHTYAVKGMYEIVLTVEDDDGGVGQVNRAVQVVDAVGAIQSVVEALNDLLDDPALDRGTARALRKAISMLQGNGGGSAHNGALDSMESGQLNAALQKVKQAMGYLVTAGEADTSLSERLEPVQRLLALAAKSAALKSIESAEITRGMRHGRDKPAQAIALIAEGDEFLEDGDYVQAVSSYQRANRVVHSMF